MEGPDASLTWEWQDELLASLDAHSPLDTTHTLWEDINQSEGMLEMTPASKFSKEDQESIWDVKAKHGYSSELIYEDSGHIKRRRMLHFEDEEDDGVFLCNSSLETSKFSSLENITNIYDMHQNGSTQMETSPSTSMWFNNVDDDIVNVELCNDDDKLNGSFTEGECEPHEFLGREAQQELPLIIESANTYHTKNGEGEATQTKVSTDSHLQRSLLGRSMSFNKMATPVAYPFAVVKPSGIQGDVTLNDINKRIMMVHNHPRGLGINGLSMETCQTGGDGGYTSNLLAKPMVAFTKIHTEGNGTITIMRTKN